MLSKIGNLLFTAAAMWGLINVLYIILALTGQAIVWLLTIARV